MRWRRQSRTWSRVGRRTRPPCASRSRTASTAATGDLDVGIQVQSRPQGGRVIASIECCWLRSLLQFHHPHAWDTSGNLGGTVGAAVAHDDQFDEAVNCRLTQRGEGTFDHRCFVVRRNDHGAASLDFPRKAVGLQAVS